MILWCYLYRVASHISPRIITTIIYEYELFVSTIFATLKRQCVTFMHTAHEQSHYSRHASTRIAFHELQNDKRTKRSSVGAASQGALAHLEPKDNDRPFALYVMIRYDLLSNAKATRGTTERSRRCKTDQITHRSASKSPAIHSVALLPFLSWKKKRTRPASRSP